MGYNTSSAALAYDMNAMPAYRETPQAPVAPREQRTPRFDVYTGAGRQANAELTDTLEKATDESSDLEVMHSVYGADTRIRDLAGAYGMVEPSESVTLDFSQDAAAGANATATAQ